MFALPIDKIRYITKSLLPYLALGIIAYAGLIIILMNVIDIPGEAKPVSYIYEEYNQVYLFNLLPLLFLLAGIREGNRKYKRIQAYEKQIKALEANVSRTIEFASEIGDGNLDHQFVPVNGETTLGISLNEMRERLLQEKDKEKERKEIMRMVSQVSHVLRNNTQLDSMCDALISYLVHHLENVVQGAMYVVKEKEEILEMKASFAYDRKKHMQAEFKFAQGLVGQAAIERQSIYRTEIPENYMTVSSGLIEHKKPNSILLQPLISNEEVYGVIELASFGEFSSMQLNLMEELSEIIARTIFNVRINKKTYDLLNESRTMSAELEGQKQQLEEQAEEMIATQEKLQESNSQLEIQISEVHKNQKKTHVLLENASEIITIYSEDSILKYVSPSIKSIMGYFPEELMNKNALENVHPQDAEAFREFFKRLISFPEQTQTLQYRYFSKKGLIIWLEATGKNFISDPVIEGIVINSRDISVQILAEKEQRMRAKMQALSENSLDIILRIDIFSRCTYINPVIENYTGLKTSEFIDKPLMDIDVNKEIVNGWKEIFENVAKHKEKQNSEIKFPTPDDVKTMAVTAIPEFYESGDIESVLLVCHDITEAKQREEVIQLKNKSISDSINYAYYIQSSLMPKEEQIRKYLPNSFMFYKPKDVVSGDYPWLSVNGDNIYVGAMDCTGHGVPGALMSLIGFFSQNEIHLQNQQITAGEAMDLLHASVVKTLRQDEEDSKTKDGMDAAFCKINLKKKELQYAGAHRPLYYVSDGKLQVIKGNKFPVGGTQYGDRDPFTNNVIKLQAGDAVYIMTDGFPDQYGGDSGKEKYMSGRVKQLIANNTHLSIFQMGNLFKNTFYDWKGETKQMDDVLIIGMKF